MKIGKKKLILIWIMVLLALSASILGLALIFAAFDTNSQNSFEIEYSGPAQLKSSVEVRKAIKNSTNADSQNSDVVEIIFDYYSPAYKSVIENASTAVSLTKDNSNKIMCYRVKNRTSTLTGEQAYSVYVLCYGDIIAPADCSYMFSDFDSLENISLRNLNTEKTTNMSSMFANNYWDFSLDLSGLDTRNVTDMSYMFSDNSMLRSLNLSTLNTKKVEDMSGMFSSSPALSDLNISNFNTSNVTDMNNMFYNCYALEELDLTNFNTEKVVYMYDMFTLCASLKILNISTFNTQNVINFDSMFYSCYSLQTIYASEYFVTTNCTSDYYMFLDCENLTGGAGTTYDSYYTTSEYARIDGGEDMPGYFTAPITLLQGWEFSASLKITGSSYSEDDTVERIVFDFDSDKYTEIKENAEKSFSVAIDSSEHIMCYKYVNENGLYDVYILSKSVILANHVCNSMFFDFEELTSIEFNNFNTYFTEETSDMFYGCSCLENLDISNFNTSKVIYMDDMFYEYQGENLTLGNLDTRNVINMSSMFYGCSNLTKLDVSGFNTAKVTAMRAMFKDCVRLTELDVSSFDISQAYRFNGMFSGCSSLTTIYANEAYSWADNFNSPIDEIFEGCVSLPNYNSAQINILKAYVGNGGYFTDARQKQVTIISGEEFNNYVNSLTSKPILTTTFGYYSHDEFGEIVNNNRGVPLTKDGSNSVLAYFIDSGNDWTVDLFVLSSATIMADGNCSGMFRCFENIINLDNFNTSNATDMSYMFASTTYLSTVGFGEGFDTSNVTDMSYMFAGPYFEYLDLTNFNTGKVTNMSSMFDHAGYLRSLDLSSFNTENVTNMSGMFNGCISLTNLTFGDNFNTSNVTNMSSMFNCCLSLKGLDLSNFNTNKVTDMRFMFYLCESLTELDLSSFNTSNVTNMSSMFASCRSIEELVLNSFNTSNVENMSSMFEGCTTLTELDLSDFNTSNVTTMSCMFNFCSSLKGLDLSNFNTSNVTTMSFMFANCRSIEELVLNSFNTSNVENMSSMFESCTKLTELDLSNFNTEKVNNMSAMFVFCENLADLDISSFNTQNVTDMYAMFYSCYDLTSLDLSSFNTEKVVNVSMMFNACKSLTELDLSNFNTENVEKIESIFEDCDSLTKLNVSNWQNTKITDMSNLFNGLGRLTELNLTNFNTSNVTDMSSMFYDCRSLTELDLSSFNTNDVTDMSSMFSHCNSLTGLDLSDFNTSKVTDMSYMFYLCELLTELDLSSFNTENVTDMSDMFNSCSDLTKLDLSNFDTSNVENMSYMFYLCESLTELDLSGFNTSKVESMFCMFSACGVEELNLSNFSAESLLDASSMFDGSAIKSIVMFKNSISLANVDSMFENCTELKNITFPIGFSTESVYDMNSMFMNCYSLEVLDVSLFNTSSVMYMDYMFENCNYLQTIYADESFVTESVASADQMFGGCNSLVGGNRTSYSNMQISDSSLALVDGYDQGYFTSVAEKGTFVISGQDFRNFIDENTDQKDILGISFIAYNDYNYNTYYDEYWENIFTNAYKVVPLGLEDSERYEILMYVVDSQLSGKDGVEIFIISTGQIIADYVASNMFASMEELMYLNLENLNVNEVQEADNIFGDCESLCKIFATDEFGFTGVLNTEATLFTNCWSLGGGSGTAYDPENDSIYFAIVEDEYYSITPEGGYFTHIYRFNDWISSYI